jgi:hypothetical protein
MQMLLAMRAADTRNHPKAELIRFATTGHGVFSRVEARRLGCSDGPLYRLTYVRHENARFDTSNEHAPHDHLFAMPLTVLENRFFARARKTTCIGTTQ